MNDEVSKLKSEKDVKAYVKDKLGAMLDDSFVKLPLEKQKAAIAGISNTIEKYGTGDVRYIDALESRRGIEGSYSPSTRRMSFAKSGKDLYVVATHETVHSIDAEVSSHYKKYSETPGDKAYNLHSEKVLKDARKKLGLRKNSKEYQDFLFRLFDGDSFLYRKYKNDNGEIVARAIDRYESGFDNDFYKTIAEGFADV